MNPFRISRRKEYYRLISSGFIHKDYLHLFFNMFSLYFFGPHVEWLFQNIFGFGLGSFYYLLLYFLALVLSDAPTLMKYKNYPHYNSLGASGAVSAVIFAFIIFQPLEKICLYGIFCFPGFILGSIFLIYSYYQAKNSRDQINHDAHLYGALFGLIFCVILYPPSLSNFFHQLSQWQIF